MLITDVSKKFFPGKEVFCPEDFSNIGFNSSYIKHPIFKKNVYEQCSGVYLTLSGSPAFKFADDEMRLMSLVRIYNKLIQGCSIPSIFFKSKLISDIKYSQWDSMVQPEGDGYHRNMTHFIALLIVWKLRDQPQLLVPRISKQLEQQLIGDTVYRTDVLAKAKSQLDSLSDAKKQNPVVSALFCRSCEPRKRKRDFEKAFLHNKIVGLGEESKEEMADVTKKKCVKKPCRLDGELLTPR